MKKYFIDLDNTLCKTTNSDYPNSTPIKERIDYVNQLKTNGNHITIWTARGSTSGIDHRELTIQQLQEWNVLYDELKMGKPDYDFYYDDKSFHIDSILPIPDNKSTKTKKEESQIVEKGWGKEIIFANNEEYCGKILCFNKGKRFSMHYHNKKKETWYVLKGQFVLIWIELDTGTKLSEILNVGDVVTNERGEPHQLIALEDGEILEVSTQHFDSDSYRIWKGD
jgi:quercetin dioxygenase-like cupin family protein